MVLVNQHHRNPSCGNLRRPHWTLAFCVLCGGKGTAPGCAHSLGAQRYQAKMFQATGLCSHKQRPPIMHAYGGAKTGMAQALQSIASEGWLPLAAAMVGTSDKPPLWTDLGLRPVVGTTLDIKLEPCALARRKVALLLSCWKRWDTKSVADSAINTWLKGANPEFGPDCEDSPCYGIRKMNVLEVMRLFGECGFEFLPETDLQRRPGLEVVMTVGLHLCALEMTDQQVDTLACIALAGQLPEFFPLLEWSYAVKKSFMSQEVVTCANRDQWNEVCTMLQEVSNTELSLRSKNGTTLWTKANPCLPTPEDDAFPLQVKQRLRPCCVEVSKRYTADTYTS